MTYDEELRARLDAVRPQEEELAANIATINTQEEKILRELDGEFSFGQYDLDESDILRTLKILDILQSYNEVFKQKNALRIFYILCRIDVITVKNLHQYCQLDVTLFKSILNTMARSKLVVKNSSNELELTLEGKSLAERIGVDIFF